MVPCFISSAQQTGKWGDQGNGFYRNPVIAGDYCNPDVVRVKDDYYMVSSANQLSPGIQILHSKDLINWKTIGAAFSDVSLLGPNFNWDKMNNYGAGLYAPSIVYHNHKFWVYANCYRGEGFWMSTATNPAGPWTPVQIKDRNGMALRISGWTDPFPFWDDDGKAYLAASNPGNKWYSYLFQMSPDGTQLLDADFNFMIQKNAVHDNEKSGTIISAYRSSEANKIYKRSGYYYIFHIEFLNDGRGCGTYVYRSKHILWNKK